jgi:hypothetical protein
MRLHRVLKPRLGFKSRVLDRVENQALAIALGMVSAAQGDDLLLGFRVILMGAGLAAMAA